MSKINTEERIDGLPSIEDVKRWFQLFMGFNDGGAKMREDMETTYFGELQTVLKANHTATMNAVGAYTREQLNPDFLKIVDGIEENLKRDKKND